MALLRALIIAMEPIKAVQSPYYGDNFYRTPPPDLPSLLLKERIVYLGLPLVAEVTKLIIAELLYLQSDDPDKPIKIYINSTGTSSYNGDPVGFETEAFAVYDTMRYIKPPIHTICIGSAMGMAAMPSKMTDHRNRPKARWNGVRRAAWCAFSA